MNSATSPTGPFAWLKNALQAWNRFFFTPIDPSVLCWIRITGGMIAVYTLIAYSLDLQEFHGKNGLVDLELRLRYVRELPVHVDPLFSWGSEPTPEPKARTPEEAEYIKRYQEKFRDNPPLPFPRSPEEAQFYDDYRRTWGADPRLLLTRGMYCFSLWFHVTDPTAMVLFHIGFILIAVALMVGFCTRIAAFLTWAGLMTYTHRNPMMLFGFDTMLLIVLMYLMFCPCGAYYSVDRWLAGWWHRYRRLVIYRWRRFWAGLLGRPVPPGPLPEPDPTPLPPVEPSVAAGFTLRLLQIHVCIIYAAAGFAKLKGSSWWSGFAVWGTLANPEFAPMYVELYLNMLQRLTKNRLLLEIVLTIGTFFTLFFEITYCFLIWHRSTRWLVLSMALLLHGFIAIFMGLKTFALIMLVMNIAFLPPNTLSWLAGLFKEKLQRIIPPDEEEGASSNGTPSGPPPETAVRPNLGDRVTR